MISENFLKIPCNYPQIILKHLAKIFEEEQRLFKNLEGSSKISKDPLRIFKNLCKDLSSAHVVVNFFPVKVILCFCVH